jgi:hypothetical protein
LWGLAPLHGNATLAPHTHIMLVLKSEWGILPTSVMGNFPYSIKNILGVPFRKIRKEKSVKNKK